MKTLIQSILCLACLTITFPILAQENMDGFARVQKVMGVEAYFLSEPTREYEVVLSEGPGFSAASFFTGGLVNETISTRASKFVKKAIEEAKGQGKEFDAIIYNSGKSIVAVKFTDEATLSNKGIGKVQKIDAVEVYILSEPLKDYKLVNKKNSGLKIKSLVTAGLINNSIEQDIAKMIRRIKSDAKFKSKKVDAVIYSAGRSGIGVEFE